MAMSYLVEKRPTYFPILIKYEVGPDGAPVDAYYLLKKIDDLPIGRTFTIIATNVQITGE